MKDEQEILPPLSSLRELLDYDPDTGVFLWKVSRGNASAGSTAGWLSSVSGYRRIVINGVQCLAHRLAWKIANGSEPVTEIDHINNDRSDNRIANLREATRSQQRMNTTGYGSSQFLGVSWHNPSNKWRSRITVNGKTNSLGYYDSESAAATAYNVAAAKHFGEFANLNEI